MKSTEMSARIIEYVETCSIDELVDMYNLLFADDQVEYRDVEDDAQYGDEVRDVYSNERIL